MRPSHWCTTLWRAISPITGWPGPTTAPPPAAAAPSTIRPEPKCSPLNRITASPSPGIIWCSTRPTHWNFPAIMLSSPGTAGCIDLATRPPRASRTPEHRSTSRVVAEDGQRLAFTCYDRPEAPDRRLTYDPDQPLPPCADPHCTDREGNPLTRGGPLHGHQLPRNQNNTRRHPPSWLESELDSAARTGGLAREALHHVTNTANCSPAKSWTAPTQACGVRRRQPPEPAGRPATSPLSTWPAPRPSEVLGRLRPLGLRTYAPGGSRSAPACDGTGLAPTSPHRPRPPGR